MSKILSFKKNYFREPGEYENRQTKKKDLYLQNRITL